MTGRIRLATGSLPSLRPARATVAASMESGEAERRRRGGGGGAQRSGGGLGRAARVRTTRPAQRNNSGDEPPPLRSALGSTTHRRTHSWSDDTQHQQPAIGPSNELRETLTVLVAQCCLALAPPPPRSARIHSIHVHTRVAMSTPAAATAAAAAAATPLCLCSPVTGQCLSDARLQQLQQSVIAYTAAHGINSEEHTCRLTLSGQRACRAEREAISSLSLPPCVCVCVCVCDALQWCRPCLLHCWCMPP